MKTIALLCWSLAGCALFERDPYRDPCEVRYCEKASKYDEECVLERCISRAELEQMLRR